MKTDCDVLSKRGEREGLWGRIVRNTSIITLTLQNQGVFKGN